MRAVVEAPPVANHAGGGAESGGECKMKSKRRWRPKRRDPLLKALG